MKTTAFRLFSSAQIGLNAESPRYWFPGPYRVKRVTPSACKTSREWVISVCVPSVSRREGRAAKKPNLSGSELRRLAAYSFARRASALLSGSVGAMTAPGAVRERIAFVAPLRSREAMELAEVQVGVGQPDGSPPASSTAGVYRFNTVLISSFRAQVTLCLKVWHEMVMRINHWHLEYRAGQPKSFLSCLILTWEITWLTPAFYIVCLSCGDRVLSKTLPSSVPPRHLFRVLPGSISGACSRQVLIDILDRLDGAVNQGCYGSGPDQPRAVVGYSTEMCALLERFCTLKYTSID